MTSRCFGNLFHFLLVYFFILPTPGHMVPEGGHSAHARQQPDISTRKRDGLGTTVSSDAQLPPIMRSHSSRLTPNTSVQQATSNLMPIVSALLAAQQKAAGGQPGAQLQPAMPPVLQPVPGQLPPDQPLTPGGTIQPQYTAPYPPRPYAPYGRRRRPHYRRNPANRRYGDDWVSPEPEPEEPPEEDEPTDPDYEEAEPEPEADEDEPQEDIGRFGGRLGRGRGRGRLGLGGRQGGGRRLGGLRGGLGRSQGQGGLGSQAQEVSCCCPCRDVKWKGFGHQIRWIKVPVHYAPVGVCKPKCDDCCTSEYCPCHCCHHCCCHHPCCCHCCRRGCPRTFVIASPPYVPGILKHIYGPRGQKRKLGKNKKKQNKTRPKQR